VNLLRRSWWAVESIECRGITIAAVLGGFGAAWVVLAIPITAALRDLRSHGIVEAHRAGERLKTPYLWTSIFSEATVRSWEPDS